MAVEQGDIISVEKMRGCYLVVSKTFFNTAEQAVLCPIVDNAFQDPLHIDIKTDEVGGTVLCEQMRLIDLRYRGYKKVSRLPYPDIINITDAIQSIFDYY